MLIGPLVYLGRSLAEETLKQDSPYVAALQEAFDTLVSLPAQKDPGHGNNSRCSTSLEPLDMSLTVLELGVLAPESKLMMQDNVYSRCSALFSRRFRICQGPGWAPVSLIGLQSLTSLVTDSGRNAVS